MPPSAERTFQNAPERNALSRVGDLQPLISSVHHESDLGSRTQEPDAHVPVGLLCRWALHMHAHQRAGRSVSGFRGRVSREPPAVKSRLKQLRR
jgi:hypothetical protein